METFARVLMWLSIGGVAVSLIWLVVMWLIDWCAIKRSKRAVKRSSLRHGHSWVFMLACALATMYGGSKGFMPRVTYPRTDADIWYLRDSGSYVTNDHVHVSFEKTFIAPNDINIFVDALHKDASNDWSQAVCVFEDNLAHCGLSFDFVPAIDGDAIVIMDYDYQVYTDWTPSPVTHTNGVAYVAWQIGRNKPINDVAIYRTGVYTDATKVAPSSVLTNIQVNTSKQILTTKEAE